MKKGQRVLVLPSGMTSTVKDIWTLDGSLDEAFCPQSVTLQLDDDLDVSRGDMLVGLEVCPGVSVDLQARVCWMAQRPLTANRKFLLKHTTQTTQAVVTTLDNKTNINTYESVPTPPELTMNDIGEVRLRTAKPLIFDGYALNRLTGSFILVEPGTNATVAAGMLLPPRQPFQREMDDFTI